MNVSILMVTYWKDLAFAEYAMLSCKKFATGFHEFVLVVPNRDIEQFRAPAAKAGFIVKGFDEREGKGMCHHMAIICEADLWCPNADAILHLDADCLFTSPVSPTDYLDNDRPILWRERYESFKNYGERYGWKACVKAATGIDPEWETMCRHPSVHVMGTYVLTRNLIDIHTGENWKEYILSCKNDFPQTFAEFPTLGAVAIRFLEDEYVFVDKIGNTLNPPQPAEKLIGFWSHGGLGMVNDRHPGKTALQRIQEILA